MDRKEFGCVIKAPPSFHAAAKNAVEHNMQNAPTLGAVPRDGLEGVVLPPAFIAALTTKYWGKKTRTLSVSFLEYASNALKNKILSHMNSWKCAISFKSSNSRTANVRISREWGGYWSYLGTDIMMVDGPTMNLEGFSMDTDDSEFYRVVRHETGHTLGFPHEHMRKDVIKKLDRQKTYRWFWENQGWSKSVVDEQVLTPLSEATLLPGSTKVDTTSIMCYQLPGSITVDGKEIVGGDDINTRDRKFAQTIYPVLN